LTISVFHFPFPVSISTVSNCPNRKCFDNQQRTQDDQSHALLVGTEINHTIPELCLKCTISTPAVNNPRLEDLWWLEAESISDPLMVNDDDVALEKFNQSIKFDRGRYQVTWPWKCDDCCLSNNYFLALSRMKILMNCLQSDKRNKQSLFKQNRVSREGPLNG